MGRIPLDRAAEVLAQRPRIGLARVGGAHQRPPLPDGVRRLERHQHAGTRRHEVGEPAEERTLAVDRVKAFRFLLRQVVQPHRANGEARLFDARQDRSRQSSLDGIGLDDCECAFHNPPAGPRRRPRLRRGNPPYLPRTSRILAPISAGLFTTWTPALVSAAIFSAAVPLPPAIMAPACPIRRPGGAVWPAMNPTTGFLNSRLM